MSDYTCSDHQSYNKESPLSPARFRCNHCNNRCIYGYTNPQHVSNPFGYLYLAPRLCDKCTLSQKRCKWSNI